MSRINTDKRLALVGYGLAGSAFHAPLIATTAGLELACVVTSRVERQQAVKERYPQAFVINNIDDLWQHSHALDGVVIASPNNSHFPLAMKAIEAGLPVVLDKPMVVTRQQGNALLEASKRRQIPLTVFHSRRWDDDFLTLQQLLDEETLGAVHRFESRFERWRPVPKEGWRRSGAVADGGGLLYDLGSHLIDQALVLFGAVQSVYAELRAGYADSCVDDDSFVALQHQSGVISHLWMSAVAAHLGPRFRVLGEKGAYVKEGLDRQEADLRAGRWPIDSGWGQGDPANNGVLCYGGERQIVPTLAGNYPAFYQQWAVTLAHNAPVPVDPVQALAGLTVMEAAQASAATGQVVAVAT